MKSLKHRGKKVRKALLEDETVLFDIDLNRVPTQVLKGLKLLFTNLRPAKSFKF